MNISSVVIKCAPQFLAQTVELLKNSGLCEVYAKDELGRIVVVIEGDSTEDESEKLRAIQAIPHILSAEMVYAFSEDEFAAGHFDKEGVINSLNSDMPAELIRYGGHLKDKK